MFRILYIALFVSHMAADQETVQGSSYGLPMFNSSQNRKNQHFEAVGKKIEQKRSFSSFRRRPSKGELKVNCQAQF